MIRRKKTNDARNKIISELNLSLDALDLARSLQRIPVGDTIHPKETDIAIIIDRFKQILNSENEYGGLYSDLIADNADEIKDLLISLNDYIITAYLMRVGDSEHARTLSDGECADISDFASNIADILLCSESPDPDDHEDEDRSGRVNPFYFMEHVDEMSSGEQPERIFDKGVDLGNINDLFIKPEDVVKEDEEEKEIEDEDHDNVTPTTIYEAYDEADREIAKELGYLEDEDREDDYVYDEFPDEVEVQPEEEEVLTKTAEIQNEQKFDAEISVTEAEEEPVIESIQEDDEEDEELELMQPDPEEEEETIDEEAPANAMTGEYIEIGVKPVRAPIDPHDELITTVVYKRDEEEEPTNE